VSETGFVITFTARKPRTAEASVGRSPINKLPKEPIGFRLCHELEGLLTGIMADRRVVPEEIDRLMRWLTAAAPYRDVRPFVEITEHIDRALADGVLTMEECEDLLFLAQRYTTVNPHFSSLRSGVQVLQGLLTGLTADRRLPEVEVRALREWIDTWSHLGGTWPYDECEAIAMAAIGQQCSPDVVAILMQLAAQFPIGGQDPSDDSAPPLIGAICAIDPAIEFNGRQFVFTGESGREPRAALEARVLARAGTVHDNVTKKADYLIVCDCGNPQWAYCCYGRKVEKAYLMRRDGHHIAIVHERDFWDALVD
jgi:hypothetical protein